jgi:hypothetical protein
MHLRSLPTRLAEAQERSTIVNTLANTSIGRRGVLVAGLGAVLTASPVAAQVSGRMILQRGMSGGGLAQLEGGDGPRLANFGLFASAVQLPEGTTLVLGAIQWLEAGTDLQLQSIEVVRCVPIPDRSDGAQISGRMRVNGEGDYPFVIRAYDGGRPGSALDRIEVEVNTEAARELATADLSDDGFTYEATGTLVAGDLQWIIADIDTAG